MARTMKPFTTPSVGDTTKWLVGTDGHLFVTIRPEDTDIKMAVERMSDSELEMSLELPKDKSIELTDVTDPDKGKQLKAIMDCISMCKIATASVAATADKIDIKLAEDSSLSATDPTTLADILKEMEKAVKDHNDNITAPVVTWEVPANDGDSVERWIAPDGTISDTSVTDAINTIIERVKDGEYQLQILFPATKVALDPHGRKLSEIINGALKMKEITADTPDTNSIIFDIKTDTNANKKVENDFAKALVAAIKKHNAAIASKAGTKAEPTDLITLEADKSPNGSTLLSIPGLQKRATENYIRMQRAAGLTALLPKEYKLSDGTILKVADVS